VIRSAPPQHRGVPPVVPLAFALALLLSFVLAHRMVLRHRVHADAEARAQAAEGAWLEELLRPVPDDPFA
jgi:hypothetical protein